MNLSKQEKSSCGVGFLVSLKNEASKEILDQALNSLKCIEHRGGTGKDHHIGDGSGLMTSIPYDLFGLEMESFAVGMLFVPTDEKKWQQCKTVFEMCFQQMGLNVIKYRDVPVDDSALSPLALLNKPNILQVVIQRPKHCRTINSFEIILHTAKQLCMTQIWDQFKVKDFFFASLSPRTIVYKALCVGEDLSRFYLDLRNPQFKVNFALFHRRFSTNTTSTWDKVQPFRMIAHNGEINTIEGNKAWGISREKALGLRKGELITHSGVSDSGNLNEMVEALKYRSSIPQTSEILSILMPPAIEKSEYYDFWSRGMEPWGGPAMVAFCDGKNIGARLDRNGFRPSRWMRTDDTFYLCSEAGTFEVGEGKILHKGSLYSGSSVTVNALAGTVSFRDSSKFTDNLHANFESNLKDLPNQYLPKNYKHHLQDLKHFNFSREDIIQFINSTIINQKEPIGSMGDTARLAFLSDLPRSFYDFFYQDFAQVTNPPLDYIREKSVTDMRVYLGRKPNIFEPKELIPPKINLALEGPILSLGQLEFLKNPENGYPLSAINCLEIPIHIKNNFTVDDFNRRLEEISVKAVEGVKRGYTIIILTDRNVPEGEIPLPAIFVLRSTSMKLNKSGRRLRCSIIVDSGDIKNSHHVACLLGFGATAVCPYLVLEKGYYSSDSALQHVFPRERERRIISAFSEGVLRIIAKRGISTLRSYQGSQLFSILGFAEDVIRKFFPLQDSILGGLDLEKVVEKIKRDAGNDGKDPKKLFLYKEHPTEKLGERHSLTSQKSRFIHKILQIEDFTQQFKLFKEFSSTVNDSSTAIRHLLSVEEIENDSQSESDSRESILKLFGSGGMSFGAISAESQRDLILAFEDIGGRCNSGEGGENPYFEKENISANVKQIASGRFGVTAEYLVNSQEVQIKIAQGAKPGEGGQLMGLKVTKVIAKARYSKAGVDLISPPPHHDIYSIEDLKQLIYELKQLKPNLKVSVKLVAGKNIGAISVGVAKAGADIIMVSGGEGGTGAANLLSMKHAGLPFEVGLIEVHHALVDSGFRKKVVLRTDGGLMTGKDIVLASILGADEFDFGKLLLVSQGCIMARVCEKNTCPTGIATHDVKFKKKYVGNKDKVVTLLNLMAEDTLEELKLMNATSLAQIRGKTKLLRIKENCAKLAENKGFKIDYFKSLFIENNLDLNDTPQTQNKISSLNKKILQAVRNKSDESFSIASTDRAVPMSLSGVIAGAKINQKKNISMKLWEEIDPDQKINLNFTGSAGQGFGIFLPENVSVTLRGEANDSVGKGLSGGKIHILPHPDSTFNPIKNTIIGNGALYGATSGELFAYGKGGDRFAVRNSGANAVIEGVGIHALEYMTGGRVIILGSALGNVGAGMTGGILYIANNQKDKINHDYLIHVPFLDDDFEFIREKLSSYIQVTDSSRAKEVLELINQGDFPLSKFLPRSISSRSD